MLLRNQYIIVGTTYVCPRPQRKNGDPLPPLISGPMLPNFCRPHILVAATVAAAAVIRARAVCSICSPSRTIFPMDPETAPKQQTALQIFPKKQESTDSCGCNQKLGQTLPQRAKRAEGIFHVSLSLFLPLLLSLSFLALAARESKKRKKRDRRRSSPGECFDTLS